MAAPNAVVIGPSHVLVDLATRVGPGPSALLFSDTEVPAALRAIVQHRPALIVLERMFAATPRGTALMARIRSDDSLAASEVRIVAHDGSYARTVTRARPAAPAASPGKAPTPANLDPAGTRRSPRFHMLPGTDARVDGMPVRLVDLSLLGAQVVSPNVLRPNQRVQVLLADTAATIVCRGIIAWACFERSKDTGQPCYRAGIEFIQADAEAVGAFCQRHTAAD